MEHVEDKSTVEHKSKEPELDKEQEGCSTRSESSGLRVSTVSDLLGSSTNSDGDQLQKGLSNRYVMALGNQHVPRTKAYSVTDVGKGNAVEESTKRDFKTSILASVSSTNDCEAINHRQKDMWQNFFRLAGGIRSRNFSGASVSEKQGGISLSSKEKKEMESVGIKELKPLMTKQKNKVLGGVSTRSADNCRSHTQSNQQPGGDDRSKVLQSSSFTNFFRKQSREDKAVECTEPEVHYRPHSAAMTQYEKQLITLSAHNSGVLADTKASQSLPPLPDKYLVGPVASHGKITLRDWLSSGASEMKKVERLRLFKLIVELVDLAHCEGIGLLDLRPSKFIFASPDSIKYTGSSVPIGLMTMVNQAMTKKKPLEQDAYDQREMLVKKQKLGKDMESMRHESQIFSAYCTVNETIGPKSELEPEVVQMEKKWYACPEELHSSGLLSSNIYNLGILLFELLCQFASPELHFAAMLDLRDRILPANFLSENPKEAGFCFWLLHPEPSCRPTTREILQSESIYSSEDVLVGDNAPSMMEKEEDVESELLLHFLDSLKEQRQNHVSSLLESIKCLETDIRKIGSRHEQEFYSDWMDQRLSASRSSLVSKDRDDIEILPRIFSSRSMIEEKLNLMKNISQLENAYFSLKSQAQITENSSLERADKALLSIREKWFEAQDANKDPNMEEKLIDRVGVFFEGICRFARYSTFQVCGTKWNADFLNSANVICSLSFDRDEEYIAAAGVSKKIKIFEFGSLLDDPVDIQYPMVEMSNRSKLSCVCWNQYIQHFLASTDYDGIVQIWDASNGQCFAQYIEHQKRAWSVDFSCVDPAKFASGSDDCSVKLWSINDRNSIGTIWNPANVCCVQFSTCSSYILAFGSADYKIYCYDLRHTRIPWCALAGHGKAVSYVKFMDSETLVSASTDNTLKLWDLKNTTIEGSISNACSLTFSGHTNEKVFAYYRSLPMPIASHKFGSFDPISGHELDESNGQFVSSVCFRRKSNIVVAANSSGSIKLLQMV
ncbi:protein SUPPRESSOR OF PHYA-105 1 isoform X3 [Coffea arabica]|uniref:Protein SUPPRESSOR OF PHYA-105 1 isoform X3 n=1 Tax=Coffea arabica TaxID=13443 RepID=A0ABM4WZZ2_COFAR|nr:protein SUPPRESSOR OF PHYA-105 1-like isoform X3 [Coffea arabica]